MAPKNVFKRTDSPLISYLILPKSQHARNLSVWWFQWSDVRQKVNSTPRDLIGDSVSDVLVKTRQMHLVSVEQLNEFCVVRNTLKEKTGFAKPIGSGHGGRRWCIQCLDIREHRADHRLLCNTEGVPR